MRTDGRTDGQVVVGVHGLCAEPFASAPVFVRRLRIPFLRSACLHPASFNDPPPPFFFFNRPHGATCLSAPEASHVQTHQADVECSPFFLDIFTVFYSRLSVCVTCTIKYIPKRCKGNYVTHALCCIEPAVSLYCRIQDSTFTIYTTSRCEGHSTSAGECHMRDNHVSLSFL